MPDDIQHEKEYAKDAQSVHAAALKSVEKLSGKIVTSVPADLRFEVKFDKTLLGKVLGDRTHLICAVVANGDGSKLVIDAYPLDAVGRKLMFGARKGVSEEVLRLFTENLENNLK